VTNDAADLSTGHLEVRDADGAEQKRVVSSRTCTEVAKALALVAALILDPDAQDPLAPAPPPAPAPPRPHGATGGIGPTLAPVLAPVLGAVDHPSSLIAPSFRVTASAAFTSSGLATGTATYTWLGGTLRACPVRARARFIGGLVRVGPVDLECGGEISGFSPLGASGEYEYAWVRLTASFMPQKLSASATRECRYGRHEAHSDGPFAVTVWGVGLDAATATPEAWAAARSMTRRSRP
jgi:hypothetical protein